MKKFITMLMLVSFVSTTTFTPKAEALIGLMFKAKSMKAIGGIGALGGAVITGGSLIAIKTANNLATAILAATVSYAGLILAGVGLIILDDGQVADIEFRAISDEHAKSLTNFTESEIAIYNSEVEELNAIRQTVVAESEVSEDTKDAEKLWLEYSDALSPETFEIAKYQAKMFIEKLGK